MKTIFKTLVAAVACAAAMSANAYQVNVSGWRGTIDVAAADNTTYPNLPGLHLWHSSGQLGPVPCANNADHLTLSANQPGYATMAKILFSLLNTAIGSMVVVQYESTTCQVTGVAFFV